LKKKPDENKISYLRAGPVHKRKDRGGKVWYAGKRKNTGSSELGQKFVKADGRKPAAQEGRSDFREEVSKV